MKFLGLFSILLFWSASMFAQGTWTIYTTANSDIPFNKPFALEIDKQGKVWIGYDNSGIYPHLASFDGTTWTSYLNEDWVNDIAVDSAGIVWVATSNGDLRSFDGTLWTTHTPTTELFPWTDPLVAGENGVLWMIDDNDLVRYDGSTWTEFTPENSDLPDNRVNAMTWWRHALWIGTQDSGLVRFDGTSWTIYPPTMSSVPMGNISALCIDNLDRLCMASSNGAITIHDGSSWDFTTTPVQYAMEMTVTPNGEIWAVGDGAYRLVNGSWQHYDASVLGTNQILSVGAAPNGDVWVGTWGDGLAVYRQTINAEDPPTASAMALRNYPNPFAQTTEVQVSLAAATRVNLRMFDALGREVRTVANEILPAGSHSFRVNSAGLNEGLYYFVLSDGTRSVTHKTMLMKR